MLPGGMMPVTQLVAVVRSTPPKAALGLLLGLPADRLPVVLAELRTDVARLLPVAGPTESDRIVSALTDEQLVELIQSMPDDQARTVVSGLPTDRLPHLIDRLPVSALSSLPDDQQQALVTSMRPDQARDVMSTTYERGVMDALVRANTEVTIPPEAPPGILLVHVLDWWVTVAARHGDDGRVAVRDAEDAALRMGTHAALSVTTNEPAQDVLRYCAQARRQGWSITATMWHDERHDTLLKRSLVSLLRS
jgi:hypothetical protein